MGGLALGIPIGFLYLLFFTTDGVRMKRVNFAKGAFIGGMYFTLYTLLVYLLCKHTELHVALCVFITTTVVLTISYVYYLVDKD